MKPAKGHQGLPEKIENRFKKHGIELTLGGEPSYIPIHPEGPEWNFTALGPTKLQYAYTMAAALQRRKPGGLLIFSPGKCYPGEVNPRWALHLVWNRDGSSVIQVPEEESAARLSLKQIKQLRTKIVRALHIPDCWHEAGTAWVLPIDCEEGKWRTERWVPAGEELPLTAATGPAGLRLPLHTLPEDAIRRALVLELVEERLHVFLPPLAQEAYGPLLQLVEQCLGEVAIGRVRFEGYVPSDSNDAWQKLSLTPDPGVLEINLPPCRTWREYEGWLKLLEEAAVESGLCTIKKRLNGSEAGTGGGNHLLFGGASLERHPFFTRPQWLASLLRYWQRHPALAYLFTGDYYGPSSQAPRPDESAADLYDLEMGYTFLESLPEGTDHRHLLSETLRHLHTDTSGNTHRSEISFDKFWNAGWDGGCRGLIEFRAVESLPTAEWMAAVALLWKALAIYLLENPCRTPLMEFGDKLHDRFFLPSVLWEDLDSVLTELAAAGWKLDRKVYQKIWDWRFPAVLEDPTVTVRRACEAWPLLCETPLEGGSTSRFVDTSMERLEFVVRPGKTQPIIRIQGRPLKLLKLTSGLVGAGFRFRRSALYPSLHPGILPQVPLSVEITGDRGTRHYILDPLAAEFRPATEPPPKRATRPVQRLKQELVTFDLRLP